MSKKMNQSDRCWTPHRSVWCNSNIPHYSSETKISSLHQPLLLMNSVHLYTYLSELWKKQSTEIGCLSVMHINVKQIPHWYQHALTGGVSTQNLTKIDANKNLSPSKLEDDWRRGSWKRISIDHVKTKGELHEDMKTAHHIHFKDRDIKVGFEK